MTDTGFNDFRAVVLADLDMQRKLRDVNDREEFVQVVVETARRAGFFVTAEDVDGALRSGRRTWIERWI